MRDKIIYFPQQCLYATPTMGSDHSVDSGQSKIVQIDFANASKQQAEAVALQKMRQQFDQAMQNWSLEESEIPELNKMLL